MKKKICITVLAIILIAGFLMAAVKGFNVDAMYANATRLNVYMGVEFDKDAIKEMASEIFAGREVLVQKVRPFQDVVAITTSAVTDTEIQTLVDRLNETYGLEVKVEDVVKTELPYMELKDMLKQYALPLTIAWVITLLYMGVRFRKLGVIHTMSISLGTAVIAEAVLVCLYAITRLPVNMFAIAASLACMGLSVVGATMYLENKMQQEEPQQEEKEA